MKIFILASKLPQERWLLDNTFSDNEYKELLLINEEPLLKRVQRQIYDILNEYPFIITNIDKIKENSYNVIVPENNLVSLQTIMSTYHLWESGERIIFLYGDVLFSDVAINTILKSDKDFLFFGDAKCGETFGFTFINDGKVKQSIDGLLEMWESKNRQWYLMDWHLYRKMSGLELDKHTYNYDYFYDIQDGFTRDFDYKRQYIAYLKEFENYEEEK